MTEIKDYERFYGVTAHAWEIFDKRGRREAEFYLVTFLNNGNEEWTEEVKAEIKEMERQQNY